MHGAGEGRHAEHGVVGDGGGDAGVGGEGERVVGVGRGEGGGHAVGGEGGEGGAVEEGLLL